MFNINKCLSSKFNLSFIIIYVFLLCSIFLRLSFASIINDEQISISNLKNVDIKANDLNNKYTGRIPDTGQTTCFDNEKEIPCPQPGEDFYGQDGNYLINEPSYTKLDENGNDLPESAEHWVMVRDNITGLIWEVKTDDGSIHDRDNTYSWYDSNPETNGGYEGTVSDEANTEDFINSLNKEKFGGFSDWRLPSVKELVYIMEYKKNKNISYFNMLSDKYKSYWTSETYYLDTKYAYCIYPSNGRLLFTQKNISSGEYIAIGAIAIRGNNPIINKKIFDNQDGTYTDTSTGLRWKIPIDKNDLYWWQELFQKIDTFEKNDFFSWRIPNYKEVISISDFSNPNATIKPFIKKLIPYLSTISSSTSLPNTNDILLCLNKYADSGRYKTNVKFNFIATSGGQNMSQNKLHVISPLQASFLTINSKVLIEWDTKDIPGNVKILLSRNIGKDSTFEIINDNVENDGLYEWIVTGPPSYNCALKIEPINDPLKGNIQSFFSIIESDSKLTQHFNTIWNGNPLESMVIWILPESYNNLALSIGDEIAIFDGNTCVGVGIINNENNAINIITSKNDNEITPNGFNEGNPIQFKIWDYSQQKEISDIKADVFDISTLDPISDNTFHAKDDKCVVLRFPTNNQEIHLDEGWNIISFNVTHENPSIDMIFKRLMANSSLVKVIDEVGNRLIYSAISKDWVNKIGNISNENGYMVKMKEKTSFRTNGVPVDLPFDIRIKKGWNIIGYPGTQPKDALTVLDSLIQNNSLEKIIDEKGNRLIYSFFQQKWINDIGDFMPGHGYNLKAKEIDRLTITKPDSNSKKLRKKSIEKRSTQTSHFQPIWNTPFSSMSLWLFDIKNFDESNGDEIGIFDNEQCVGSAIITDTLSIQNNITIILSKHDGDSTINGFIEGNPIIFKIWDKDQNTEITDLEINYVNIMTGEAYNQPVVFTGNMDVGTFIESKTCEPPIISHIKDIIIYPNTEHKVTLCEKNSELSYTTTCTNNNISITFNNNVMTIKAMNSWTGEDKASVIVSNTCNATTQISFNLNVIPNEHKLSIESNHYGKHGMKYSVPVYIHNPEKRKIESLTMHIIPANTDVLSNNNSKLTLAGSKLDDKKYNIKYNPAKGKIAIWSSAETEFFNGSGNIAFIEFEILGNCGDSSNISFIGTNYINGMPVTTENGKLTVINSCPEFIKGPDITENEDTRVIKNGWATHIKPGKGNESSQTLTFQVTCDKPSLFEKEPEITPSGDLTYTPKKDESGSSLITVTLHDDGGTSNGGCNVSKAETFTINILEVNDCPGFTKGKDIFTSISSGKVTIPNWATEITAGPTNESNQKLTFHLSIDNEALFETLPAISPEGILTFQPKSDENGESEISVFLQDDGQVSGCNKSEIQTFTISIIKYDLSGTISYYNENRPVPNVLVSLFNDNNSYTTTSNNNGQYIFSSVSPGAYNLQLSKTDDLTGISGSDATEIAGYVVNESSFNEYQKIAVDIFNNNTITAFNAARVAQYPARNCFDDNNECTQWKFIDNNSKLPSDLSIKIDSDKKDIDFTAIRMGDVTGNWSSNQNRKRAKNKSNDKTKVIEIFKGSFLSLPVIFNVNEKITGIDLGVDYSHDDIKADNIELSRSLSKGYTDNAYTYFAHSTNDGKSSFVIYTTPPHLYTPKQAEVLLKLNIQGIGNVGSISNFSFNKLEVNENPDTVGGFLIDGQIYNNIAIKISPDPGNDEKLGLAETIHALQCNSLSLTCQSEVSLEEVLKILQSMSCFEE